MDKVHLGISGFYLVRSYDVTARFAAKVTIDNLTK
jgi:hypothetical protein